MLSPSGTVADSHAADPNRNRSNPQGTKTARQQINCFPYPRLFEIVCKVDAACFQVGPALRYQILEKTFLTYFKLKMQKNWPILDIQISRYTINTMNKQRNIRKRRAVDEEDDDISTELEGQQPLSAEEIRLLQKQRQRKTVRDAPCILHL